MKQLVKSLLVLLATCTFIYEVAAQIPQHDPDVAWLNDLLQPYANEHGGYRNQKELVAKLNADKASVDRLFRIARNPEKGNLDEEQQKAAASAMELLMWTKTDDPLGLYALHLKHPSSSEKRMQAIYKLAESGDPKALQRLLDELREAEASLPSLIGQIDFDENGEIRGSIETWRHLYLLLARMRTDETLVAIDASLERLEKKLGTTKQEIEMLEMFQKTKNEGLHLVPISPKKAVEKAAATPPYSEPSKTQSVPIETTAVSPTQQEAESAAAEPPKSSTLLWLVSLAVVFLAGIGYVFYRFRKR